MILTAISFEEMKENESFGQSLLKTIGTMPFQSKENAPFDKRRELRKGHFRSFAEKGMGPDHQGAPLAKYLYVVYNWPTSFRINPVANWLKNNRLL